MNEPLISESAVAFECEGDALLGIVALQSDSSTAVGVLIVVGGPQYRVGSHRQFVHLARQLASAGIACMRFDYRGMGDSYGESRTFMEVDADIRAAVDAFVRQVPSLSRVFLWGLCDGASAACLYAPTDRRIAGLVLANPWVRTDTTQAETILRHYYLRRLAEPDFWRKVVAGRFRASESMRSLRALVRAAWSRGERPSATASESANFRALPFPESMAGGLAQFGKDVLIVLSGDDYTAAEFRDVCRKSPAWMDALRRNRVAWQDIREANHTFSSETWRAEVALATLGWLEGLRR